MNLYEANGRINISQKWCYCAMKLLQKHCVSTKKYGGKYQWILDEIHTNLSELFYYGRVDMFSELSETEYFFMPTNHKGMLGIYRNLRRAIKTAHPLMFAKSIDDMAHKLTNGHYQRAEYFADCKNFPRWSDEVYGTQALNYES